MVAPKSKRALFRRGLGFAGGRFLRFYGLRDDGCGLLAFDARGFERAGVGLIEQDCAGLAFDERMAEARGADVDANIEPRKRRGILQRTHQFRRVPPIPSVAGAFSSGDIFKVIGQHEG